MDLNGIQRSGDQLTRSIKRRDQMETEGTILNDENGYFIAPEC